MIYVLAYPEFEPSVADSINRFRSAREPERAKLVPAHVTLVFGLRNVHPQEFFKLCESVAKRASDVTVTFTASEIAYDPYENAYKLFLLSSTGSRALSALHQQLYEGPHRAELDTSIPYRPHMTIATDRDRTVLERLDVGAAGSYPITGKITALNVVEHIDTGLHRLGVIPLGM